MGEENIMLLQTLDQNWKNTDVNMSTTLLWFTHIYKIIYITIKSLEL